MSRDRARSPGPTAPVVVGASWEGFAVEQLIARLDVRREQCFFWATHEGAELDLFVSAGGKRLGFEIKRTTVPRMTKSTQIAMTDLRLDRLDVIYEGVETYPLGERIRAVPVQRIFDDVVLGRAGRYAGR